MDEFLFFLEDNFHFNVDDVLKEDFLVYEIDRILAQLENVFVEFRYLYEQNKTITISKTLLKDFTLYINSYCNDYLKNKLR